MPAKVTDVHAMLTGKLQAEVTEGSNHTKYKIVHDGWVIASTVLSRSYREIPENLLGQIARKQLLVNRSQMRLLLDCPWKREDYIAHRLQQNA